MAIVWARRTFFAVMGKNAPALTVASLAMTITSRPATHPRPVTTPAAAAPPHSSYMPKAAKRPNSRKSAPGSSSRSSRSLAVKRFLPCWASMALGPPPSRMASSCCPKASSSASMPAVLARPFRVCGSSLEASRLENCGARTAGVTGGSGFGLTIRNVPAYHPGSTCQMHGSATRKCRGHPWHNFSISNIPRT